MSCSAKGYIYSFDKCFEVKSLAYANDLTITVKTDAVIMIRAHDCLDWGVCQLGRTLFQCHQVCYVSGKRIVFPSTFTLNGNTIFVMLWKNRYRHLGVLLGANPEAHLELKTSRWTSRASFSLFWCNLMKLEAFKEFVMPKLNCVFRTTLGHKKWTKLLNCHVRSSFFWYARECAMHSSICLWIQVDLDCTALKMIWVPLWWCKKSRC